MSTRRLMGENTLSRARCPRAYFAAMAPPESAETILFGLLFGCG